MSNDFRPIHQELRAQGFDVEQTKQGHFKVKRGVHQVTFSESGDPRALQNTLGYLKRIGFVWPPPNKRNGRTELPLERCPSCGTEGWDPKLGLCSECEKRGVLVLPGEPRSNRSELDELYESVKTAQELWALEKRAYMDAAARVQTAIAERDRASAALDAAQRECESLTQRLLKGLEKLGA